MIERLIVAVGIICIFLGIGTGICIQLDAHGWEDKFTKAFMFSVQIVMLFSLILIFRLMVLV